MSLSILNVSTGDTKLSFDKDKPAERERAARIVTDMLKRGYAILVQVGERDGRPLYQSATGFDPLTCEYLIAGLPEEEEREISASISGKEPPAASSPGPAPRRGGRARRQRKPAESTPAVAVARSAGG